MADDFYSSVRLTDAERRKLLDDVRSQRRPVEESHRAHERIEYNRSEVPLVVTHPNGEVARFLVCTRNISIGGLAFLHGGFLYPGCRCEITLPTVWGGKETLNGVIISCRHLQKHVHEFSVSFETLIDRRRFVTLPGERPLESELDTSKIAALSGRVLFIDECRVNADLAQHHIKNSKVEMVAAESLEEGVETLRSAPFDTVLLDLDNFEKTPAELIGEIREAGFKGPIVCASTTPESEAAESALEAGADEVASRPIAAIDLVRILTECLSGSSGAAGPVQCQLESSPDTVALIENYLGYIETLAASLSEDIEKEDIEKVLKSCRVISQSAGGYGFPPLEQAANKAMLSLQDSKSVVESISELQRLQSVCSRLEPLTMG